MQAQHRTALLLAAKAYLRNDDNHAALSILRLLEEVGPSTPEVALLHGAAAQRCDCVREAISAYERCLGTYGSDLQVLVGLGEMYMTERRIGPALALLEKAIALDPNIEDPIGYRARVIVMRAKDQLAS